MIEIHDELIEFETIQKIYEELTGLPYYFGHNDGEGTPPNGYVSNLSDKTFTIPTLLEILKQVFSLDQYKLSRSYCNCFAPSETNYFHQDTQSNLDRTILYYANPLFEYNANEGGGTEFLDMENKQVTSVLPITGRICIFDSSIYHRATPFKSIHRFTVALKFESIK